MKYAVPAAALAVAIAAHALAGPRTFTVDAAGSVVEIQVGKAGAFSFAGHRHEVVAPRLSGTVVADPDDLGRSSVELSFEAAALRVTGKGEPAKDVPKVQAKMVGPDVLDAERHPAISFRSRTVTGRPAPGGAWDVQVAGDITLHGVTRPLTLPMRVEIGDGVLTASGRAAIRQKDFGIEPVSAAAGTVKVKNELTVDYRIVARTSP